MQLFVFFVLEPWQIIWQKFPELLRISNIMTNYELGDGGQTVTLI